MSKGKNKVVENNVVATPVADDDAFDLNDMMNGQEPATESTPVEQSAAIPAAKARKERDTSNPPYYRIYITDDAGTPQLHDTTYATLQSVARWYMLLGIKYVMAGKTVTFERCKSMTVEQLLAGDK